MSNYPSSSFRYFHYDDRSPRKNHKLIFEVKKQTPKLNSTILLSVNLSSAPTSNKIMMFKPERADKRAGVDWSVRELKFRFAFAPASSGFCVCFPLSPHLSSRFLETFSSRLQQLVEIAPAANSEWSAQVRVNGKTCEPRMRDGRLPFLFNFFFLSLEAAPERWDMMMDYCFWGSRVSNSHWEC